MAVQSRRAPAGTVDGIIDLAPGKIATVATFLDLRATDARRLPQAGLFEPLAKDLARYRRLYARVGERWLWFSRRVMPDVRLEAIVDHPAVEALALVDGADDIGMIELDFRKPGVCELSFLGLVSEAIGRGLGQVLIGEAIRRAFSRPVARLWLHTCTLAHPGALQFYMAAGFRPYRRAVEIADDPRLAGHLPRDAAPDLPIL